MTEITRRGALTVGAGAIVAAALPAVPAAEAIKIIGLDVGASPSVTTIAWAVGTPGEFNFHAVFASSEEEAIDAWLGERGYPTECELGGKAGLIDDCDCEACYLRGSVEPARMPEWDGKTEVKSGDWIAVGWGAHCARCREECYGEDGGARVVEGLAVCEECMTIDDWGKVDPERAAEMRAEGLVR